jgi:lipopolysaccharide export system protein LptA
MMRAVTFLFFCLACVPAAWAQERLPVDISADGQMVWDRKALSFTVEGKAKAQQGDVTITADRLTARYNAADDPGDIRELNAEGNVSISSASYIAIADLAVYDVLAQSAVLTGNTLVTRGTDQLRADRMTAFFSKDENNATLLKEIRAEGKLNIKTAKGEVTADTGTYDPQKQSAVLTGNIVIVQDNARLEGSKATLDMRTGISTLTATKSKTGDGRVRAVFYPKKKTP